jgi:hypothetical protein
MPAPPVSRTTSHREEVIDVTIDVNALQALEGDEVTGLDADCQFTCFWTCDKTCWYTSSEA